MKYNLVMIEQKKGYKFTHESIVVDRVPRDTALSLLDKLNRLIDYSTNNNANKDDVFVYKGKDFTSIHNKEKGDIKVLIKKINPFDLENDSLIRKEK